MIRYHISLFLPSAEFVQAATPNQDHLLANLLLLLLPKASGVAVHFSAREGRQLSVRLIREQCQDEVNYLLDTLAYNLYHGFFNNQSLSISYKYTFINCTLLWETGILSIVGRIQFSFLSLCQQGRFVIWFVKSTLILISMLLQRQRKFNFFLLVFANFRFKPTLTIFIWYSLRFIPNPFPEITFIFTHKQNFRGIS